MRKMLQKEKRKPRIDSAKASEARFFAMPMAFMRLASSPAVNFRKKLAGSVISRPHRAASVALSMRVPMRRMAMERTMEMAAAVRLVTMSACAATVIPCKVLFFAIRQRYALGMFPCDNAVTFRGVRKECRKGSFPAPGGL